MAKKIDDKNNQVFQFIKLNPNVSSKEIHDSLAGSLAYATVKRVLQELLDQNLLATTGKGKATRYGVSPAYELLYPVDLDEYFKKEIDEREVRRNFNNSIINLLREVPAFTIEELKHLNTLQQDYKEKISSLTKPEYYKELEHLAIDLSWKSSQIEGNTYSLLETERLLKDKETAAGKTRDEATMLLNHKEALDFIIANPDQINPLSIARIEEIHSLLIKELNVERNIRRRSVSITGTNYRPLENEFLIKEALEAMCNLINGSDNVFSKSLLLLILISYIQPFMDGNKRTARIVSNAVLISANHCPLSFRTVDPITYKKAMLLFYERNNITAFKKIFIEQFEFAVRTYF